MAFSSCFSGVFVVFSWVVATFSSFRDVFVGFSSWFSLWYFRGVSYLLFSFFFGVFGFG